MKFTNKNQALAYINDNLTMVSAVGQLAEEAAELAQAALKLQRIYLGENPTPVTERDAIHNLFEELGDVLCCANVLNYPHCFEGMSIAEKNAEEKAIRWAYRIKAKKEKEAADGP